LEAISSQEPADVVRGKRHTSLQVRRRPGARRIHTTARSEKREPAKPRRIMAKIIPFPTAARRHIHRDRASDAERAEAPISS
jgi:hypothetical protein